MQNKIATSLSFWKMLQTRKERGMNMTLSKEPWGFPSTLEKAGFMFS